MKGSVHNIHYSISCNSCHPYFFLSQSSRCAAALPALPQASFPLRHGWRLQFEATRTSTASAIYIITNSAYHFRFQCRLILQVLVQQSYHSCKYCLYVGMDLKEYRTHENLLPAINRLLCDQMANDVDLPSSQRVPGQLVVSFLEDIQVMVCLGPKDFSVVGSALL